MIIAMVDEIWSAETGVCILTDLVKAAKINIIICTKEVMKWQGERLLAYILLMEWLMGK